jgi:hypothetical protein
VATERSQRLTEVQRRQVLEFGLHMRVTARMHELAEQLLALDEKYHRRIRTLEAKGTQDYHLENDVLLRQIGGSTKVVSDMLAGMSAYVIATRRG